MEFITINDNQHRIYGGTSESPQGHEATVPGFIVEREFEEFGLDHEAAAKKLRLTPSQLKQLIIGEIPITPEIALRLEQLGSGSAAIWLRLQAYYENHPKHPSRGGARPNSGPKPLGHRTKQVRITAPLEDMEIIAKWLKTQKNASRAIAQVLKEHATRAT